MKHVGLVWGGSCSLVTILLLAVSVAAVEDTKPVVPQEKASLWNGKDFFLKERFFGLTGP